MVKLNVDSNEIKEVIDDLCEMTYKPVSYLDPNLPVVFVFDIFLYYSLTPIEQTWPEWYWTVIPCWNSPKTPVLFSDTCHRVIYNKNERHFRFVKCDKPSVEMDNNCVLASSGLTFMMREAIRGMIEPIRAGQEIAKRLRAEFKINNDLEDTLSYGELCYK